MAIPTPLSFPVFPPGALHNSFAVTNGTITFAVFQSGEDVSLGRVFLSLAFNPGANIGQLNFVGDGPTFQTLTGPMILMHLTAAASFT
jgi:hypothetical protein